MHFVRITLFALFLAASATQANAQATANPRVNAKANVTATATGNAGDSEDREPTDDEELAIAALEGLMAQPPQRSMPILKKVMAGQQSTLVKRRALFVLGQVNSPEARELLLQTARTNSALRGEAIRSIGIGGDGKTLDALADVYNAGNQDVKKDVLQAWMIAGRKEAVYQAALNAKTEDEAEDAIQMLGVMGARDELRKLNGRPNTSKSLAQAFAISGDLEGLRKIAESDSNRDVRIDAVRKIGIIHSEDARVALREIYARTTDEEIKEAALNGMMISGDEQGVLTLYRNAKTPAEKKALLRTLSMMSGDAALQAIDAALEKKP